jgi:signal peptidase II
MNMAEQLTGRKPMNWQAIYDLGGLNRAIFYAVNLTDFPGWVDIMLTGTRLGNFYTAFGMYLLVAGLILIWRLHLLRLDKREVASSVEVGRVFLVFVILAISHTLSQQIAEMIKHAIAMPRPYIALPEGTVRKLDIWLSARHEYQSFPSGHAAFSAVMLFGLWPLLNRPLRIVAGVVAAWIMISRMALGVHFPSDLIVGFAIGTATVLSVRFLFSRVVKPGLV